MWLFLVILADEVRWNSFIYLLLFRFVWTVAIIGMILALFVSVIDLYTEYNKYPFLTRINVGLADSLPFPAVTLCNLNPMDRTKIRDFDKVISYFLAFTNLHFPPNQPLNWSNPDLKPFTYPMNKSWIRATSPNFSSLLFMCAWKGRRLQPPCTRNFSEHFTDMGICYTFNDANHTRQYGPLYTSHTGSMTGLVLYFYINESTYIYNQDMATGVKVSVRKVTDVAYIVKYYWLWFLLLHRSYFLLVWLVF